MASAQAVYERLRDKYKQISESSAPPQARARETSFLVKEAIGLVDKDGHYHRRAGDDFPTLAKDRKYTVSDIKLEALTKAILGPEWATVIGERRWLQEEAAAPVGPSHLANISAWTAAVGGLVQGSILEGYEVSDFDLADLFPVRNPSVMFWNGGERYPAIVGPSRPAPKFGPGQQHPDARIDAMWVEPGALAKYGQKLLITKEAAFVDITGGRVLAAARDLGMGLRYRENELCLDVITGQTNNFKLGLTDSSSATGYNTYGATVPTGGTTTATLGNSITNPISSDPLTVFNTSQNALLGYKHPITGLPMPMATRLNTLLIPSSIAWFATYVNSVQQITLGSQPGAPASQIASSTFPTGWVTANNPFAGLFNRVITSQWLYFRHIASTTAADPDLSAGLGLTSGVSGTANRWYRLDPERFACRRVAWEPTQIEFSAQSFTMADQNIVWGAAADMALQVQVLSPWAIQRNVVS
jgi:hypothetical protein